MTGFGDDEPDDAWDADDPVIVKLANLAARVAHIAEREPLSTRGRARLVDVVDDLADLRRLLFGGD